MGGFLSCAGMDNMQGMEGSMRVVKALWHTLDIMPAGEVLCPGVDAKGEIGEHSGARVAAEQLGRNLGRERPPRDEEAAVKGQVQTCVSCGKALKDRVEEEEESKGTVVSGSTGECSTYRVWYCANEDCVMFKTDLYREPIADREQGGVG